MPAILAALAVVILLFVLSVVIFAFTIPFSLYAAAAGLPAGFALTLFRSFEVLAGLRKLDVVRPEDIHVSGVPERGRKPRDYAWDHYFAGQVFWDLIAIGRRVNADLIWLWLSAWRLIPQWRLAAGHATDGSKAWPILVAWPVLAVIAGGMAGSTFGAVAALTLLGLVAIVITLCAWILGLAAAGVLLAVELLWRRVRRAAAHCTNCFQRMDLPTYHCPGPHHGGTRQMLHRYMRPGLQGLWWRRCGCGTELPATMLRAAWMLPASCSRCDAPLYRGASLVPEVRLALFGAPRSGKTWLVTNGLEVVEGTDLSIAGIGANRPDITVLQRRMGVGNAVVQVFDPDGGTPDGLVDDDAHYYFDQAMGLLFVLSGRAVLRDPGSAVPEPDMTYQTVVARLRLRGVDTRQQCLAIVITRIDQVPDAPDASLAAAWLLGHGCGNMVRAIYRDFRRARFFVCDSRAERAAAVWQWMLAELGFGALELEPRSADVTAK